MKPDISYSEIFNFKNICVHLSYFIMIMGLLYSIMLYVLVSFNKEVYTNLETSLVESNISIIDTCKVVKCEKIAIKKNDTVWLYNVSKNGVFEFNKAVKAEDYKANRKGILNPKLNMIMEFDNYEIIIDNGVYNSVLVNSFIIVSIFIFIPYALLYTYLAIRLNIKNRLSKGLYKSELETRLQRDLTEVLHHELGAPVTVLETNVSELSYLLYPCKQDITKVCSLIPDENSTIKSKCRNCERAKLLSTMDKEKITLLKDINLAIERIKSILKIISNSKKIRFSNGTVPIYAICENIVSSINSFKIRKLSASYENEEVIRKYSVRHELGNGNLLNILHVLLNNSIEAGADKVLIKANKVTSDKLELYITDNGSGIRDKHNNIILDKNIFSYGYSTKDADNTRYKSNTWFTRMLDALGFTLETNKTKRGIGLYVSKVMLEKVGGDIELVSTSTDGTTFKITFPIKKTKI